MRAGLSTLVILSCWLANEPENMDFSLKNPEIEKLTTSELSFLRKDFWVIFVVEKPIMEVDFSPLFHYCQRELGVTAN